MKIKLSVNYTTIWGQSVWVCGSVPELGNNNEAEAVRMNYVSLSEWSIELNIQNADKIKYTYLIKEGETIVRKESDIHSLFLDNKKDFIIYDLWNAAPEQKYLYTSGFCSSFFKRRYNKYIPAYSDNDIILNIKCPYVKREERLILLGSSDVMGKWDAEKAILATPIQYGVWQVRIDADALDSYQEYKLAIRNTTNNIITHWEEGGNRILRINRNEAKPIRIETLAYNHNKMYWKASGTSIPVFSLRSEKSFGIGEFSDLIKMIDWSVVTGQKIIQILPINDTTISHTRTDSYPYNSISIYALHPMYLGLDKYPLENKNKYARYRKQADRLNSLDKIDYEKVYRLKKKYLDDLFAEQGESTLKSSQFRSFYKTNREWLFPYACFCYLRDKNETADYTKWQEYSVYNKDILINLIDTDPKAKLSVEQSYYVQYLLHVQLSEVRKYAHSKGVILKGDIPIGISRKSVDAWTEPHLFNLDVQTGAPPDAFSTLGQNWGFPTYNWPEMAKDGYSWWKKRFQKMADYFDAYRIDHILGFFRIWEIPFNSVQGLLGYFSPALPYSINDLQQQGIPFDKNRMAKPFIHKDYLIEIFGDHTQEVINDYLRHAGEESFELKDFCNSQLKIKKLFENITDEKSVEIRNGLYGLCNDVLFIEDKYEQERYHPRIAVQQNYSYRNLDNGTKDNFNRLYDDFFYHRHNQFWREQAMIKLPELISATNMLVCGEDLGMIPDCVPPVMRELQILSLEIERMPKAYGVTFADLKNLPYESVCTTSTHDMSTIREWWHENKEKTLQYYNEVLSRIGNAPDDCTGEICMQIISNHLHSSSMLVIIPLQDWLSVDETLRRKDPADERINVPSDAQHYWRYRMHLTLEDLIKAEEFNDKVKNMVEASGRS